jgi:hypothetical protein
VIFAIYFAPSKKAGITARTATKDDGIRIMAKSIAHNNK